MQSPGLWLRCAGAALVLLSAFQTQSYAAAPVVTEHSLTANGIKLHYLEAGTGNGTPFVLLAGYGETSPMWLPLMPKRAVNHVVIAPDLPGVGASGIPAGGYDKKTMAQDTHAPVHP